MPANTPGIAKATLFMAFIAAVAACAGTAPTIPNQPAVPIGSTIKLNITANVPLDQDRIYIQNRMVVSAAQIDKEQIFCSVFMHRYQQADGPQLKITPGEFTVSRVRLYNDFIYKPTIYANNDDQYYSPSFGVDYRTEIYLDSSDQPEVRALTCTDHRLKYQQRPNYLDRTHFEAALGDFVDLP